MNSVPPTKGQFALRSQTVQMVCHQFRANVDAARELRQTNRKMRYPYQDKRFFPLYWPAQSVSVERGRMVLPMGRGRPSLVFHLKRPEQMGGCKLVWKDGYELPVSVPTTPTTHAPGTVQATVDLGEIHQAAVTTNTGAALVVSGRGIRSLKRRHHMALGHLAKKRKRCKPGSRRWRKLQRARRQVSARKRCQIRDLRHKGTRKVIGISPGAGRGKPVHRQPGWGAEAEQGTPSQPADGRLGVRTRHRLSHVQSRSSLHPELHWFGAGDK